MPTVTRTFRVFVSSTFENLKDERDALQRDVFPRLRKLCEENNARFQAIDLRWGVRFWWPSVFQRTPFDAAGSIRPGRSIR